MKDKESKIIHFEELSIADEETKKIVVAIVGTGGGDIARTIEAIDNIKEHNRDLEIVTCETIEDAKELGIKIVIDCDDILRRDLGVFETPKTFELTNTMCDDLIDLSLNENDKEDWSHTEGTKQKKFRKGNNRKKTKKRRK